MRILFATYPLAFQNPGGGERVLLSLQSELMRRGHAVDLFDPWKHSLSDYERIHYFSSIEPSFWRLAKEVSPKTPLVVTPTIRFADNSTAEVLRTRMLEWLSPSRRAQVSLPDFWLPATEVEAVSLQRHWKIARSRMRTLANGIEPGIAGGDPALFRKRFGIEGRFVLHVGRLHPVKNHPVLIEAAKRADAQLVLIGGEDFAQGAYAASCRDLIRESAGGVHLLAPLSQDDPLLASAYAAADLFALPSLFETFGIAALEAAAAGCPLLLSDRMQSREVFRSDAVWLDPEDVESWARELRAGLARGRASVDSESRKNYLRDYSWSAIADELEEVYASL